MRQDLSLAEPVPHPLLCSSPTPLLRVLLRETPSTFRPLVWGSRAMPPAPGAVLLGRCASLSLDDERRRLAVLSRSAPRRAERHRAARLGRLLRALLDRGFAVAQLFLTSIPRYEESLLSELPSGLVLFRLQREVEAASAELAAGLADPQGSEAASRVRLRRAVFAHVRACRDWLARHGGRRPFFGGSRRVDFSGAGPVAPDPALAMDQCGLPIAMAFELFRLHLGGELLRLGLVSSPGEARRLIQERSPSLLPVLAEVSAVHPVLLSVERCLSRHGIQAYFPVLTAGDALRLSPLALDRLFGPGEKSRVKVFVPLGDRAQQEACQRMTSPATLAAPETQGPRLELSADARLGLYLASLERTGQRGRAPLPGPRAAWAAIHAGTRVEPGERTRVHLLRELQGAHLRTFGALRGFFSSLAEVEQAIDAGELSLHAHVFVRRGGATFSTVAGRCLVMALFPPDLPGDLANTVLDRKALRALVSTSVAALGPERAARLAEGLEALGLRLATVRGLSLCAGDLAAPESKQAILDEAWRHIAAIGADYEEGLITDGERYNKSVDIWASAADQVHHEALRGLRRSPVVDRDTGEPGLDPSTNPFYLLADSGVAGSLRELRALGAMRGLVAKPSGEIHEAPITASLREGLSAHAWFHTTPGCRVGIVGSDHRALQADRIAEVLLRTLGRVRVTERDCRALGALPMRCLEDSGVLFGSLADRVRGRFHGETGQVLTGEVPLDVREIAVRSPIFCEAEQGICAVCYGLAPDTGAPPEIGEPVGLHAAHALASQLEHITVRSFHIGSSCGSASLCEAAADGVVILRPDDPGAIAVTPSGERVVMSPELELLILDDAGLVIASGHPRLGAHVRVLAGERVKRRQVLADWNPFLHPWLAEHDGAARWVDLVDSVTVHERVDEVTGLSRRVVLAAEGSPSRPRVDLVASGGVVVQTLALEAGDVLHAGDGERVSRGETVFSRPGPPAGVRDVLEGRGDLVRLLDAHTERPALLCEIGGVIQVTREADGSRTVTLRPTHGAPELVAQETRAHSIPRRRHLLVDDGERVTPGTPLVAADDDPGEILRVLGPERAAIHLVDRVQLVYALFGVALDVRHAEIVAGALLRAVRVIAPGDGPWAAGERVQRSRFARCCTDLARRRLAPPSAEPTVTGLGVRVR